jgi:hypothetical protein
MTQIDYEQDKTEWTTPPKNEQAKHNSLHFTACYDDDCWAHRQAKDGARYYPKEPKQTRKTTHGRKPHATIWQKCYNDKCTTHLAEKRQKGIFPRRNGRNRGNRPQGTEDLKGGAEKSETNEERDRRISEAIDAEEIITLREKIGKLEQLLEEEENKSKKMEERKEEVEQALEEMRRAWKWEYAMKKVVGQDLETMRKAIEEERKEHTEKEDKMREGTLGLGIEILRARAMLEILCQRIAAGEFSGA